MAGKAGIKQAQGWFPLGPAMPRNVPTSTVWGIINSISRQIKLIIYQIGYKRKGLTKLKILSPLG